MPLQSLTLCHHYTRWLSSPNLFMCSSLPTMTIISPVRKGIAPSFLVHFCPWKVSIRFILTSLSELQDIKVIMSSVFRRWFPFPFPCTPLISVVLPKGNKLVYEKSFPPIPTTTRSVTPLSWNEWHFMSHFSGPYLQKSFIRHYVFPPPTSQRDSSQSWQRRGYKEQ